MINRIQNPSQHSEIIKVPIAGEYNKGTIHYKNGIVVVLSRIEGGFELCY